MAGSGYTSPIVKQRMAEIKASNAKLAGGADYVSPIVKQTMAATPRPIKAPTGVAKARLKPGAASPLTKQLAMRAKPKTPPDITYNPTSRNIPYSTRSATAAKNIAGAGGQKSFFNHR